MTRNYESCLINRLSRFVDLADHECAFIEEMESTEEVRTKGRTLISVGDLTDGIVVIKSGWAVVKWERSDGRTQILRIYLPGEIVGLAELGTTHAHHRIAMQTDGVVCPFPRSGLAKLISDYPRLAALFIAVSSLDQIALRHNAAALGSMDARRKVQFFLLQLRARLEVANIGLGNRFQVPFSQVEIGQAVGLTSIYVNKLLRSFVEEGDIEIERPYFRLLKRSEWEAETEFVDAFTELDTSWFPSALEPTPPFQPA